MIKALLLQSCYKLSDPALEKQLARDLLFRRFVALDISESVPDHSALWRFRQTLQRLSLMDKLLNEVNQQLIEQGVLIQWGSLSIVDASVIEAKLQIVLPSCLMATKQPSMPTVHVAVMRIMRG